MDDTIERRIELQFHGIDYLITIQATPDQLYLEIEDKGTCDNWKNTFTSNYIEEITHKTGNYKKYQVFLKMLFQSFSKSSESVFVDILTQQDLEALKSKKPKQSSPIGLSSISRLNPNNKRYMILSYIVEFDKVHYPLPLNFDENPPTEQLKNTIRMLRHELEVSKSETKTNQQGIFSCIQLFQVLNENDYLKQKIKKIEDQSLVYQQKVNESQFEGISIYQRQIEEQNKELTYLKSLNEAKDREILELKNLNHRIKNETVQSEEFFEAVKRHQEAEKALNEMSQRFLELEQEVSQLVQENQTLKGTDKKQKTKITQLQSELQSTISNKKIFKYELLNDNIKFSRVSQSPTSKRSNSFLNKKSPLRKPSDGKQTPKRVTPRKNSVDSDTESSYLKKNKASPFRQQKASPYRQQKASPYKLQKSSNKKAPQKQKSTGSKKVLPKEQVKIEIDEEERLLKKLQELRQKNKENVITTSPSMAQQKSQFEQSQQQSQSQSELFIVNRSQVSKKSESSFSEDISNIDDRLNKLSNLLKQAKQG